MVRSDEEIKKIILQELAQDDQLDAAKIDIDVKNGKVALSGEVPSAAAQSSANWITTAVPGVTGVINHLTVRQPATVTMPKDKQGTVK
jgi:osmotically-inducible protein OsmY